jgi:hypothetical protein
LGNQPAGAGDRALDGLLDEVRIYNKALSASEIRQIMGGPIDNWAATFDLPAGLSLQNDDDDDGIPLLLEYALGTSPISPDKLPVEIELGETSITYHFPKLQSELSYTFEISTDLQTWTTDGVTQGSGAYGEMDTAIIQLGGPGETVYSRLVIQTTGQ